MNNSLLPPHVKAFFTPDLYPHTSAAVDMIQTHISWVFLAGDYAYKLKKPVNFGFLDFSTLADRRHYCERELLLNRRLSPEIYLDVLPVYQHGDRYALSPPGTIVDYCLKMARFEQSALLENKLLSGRFDACWMDSLAEEMARFHREQESIYAADIDHVHLLDEHIRANIEIASSHMPAVMDQGRWTLVSEYAAAAQYKLSPLLIARQLAGHVRHCHGDLHLKNITLIDGHPRVFDCIEFNDEFATIDTMNDIAFLVMDCDAHGHGELGMRFLSRYLEQSADYDGLPLLPLYLFYRAGVRGKVACLLADELEQGSDKHAAALHEARHYFELAAGYCPAPTPRLFAIGGLSGSGKSHLALLGCGVEHAVIIRSDATRKRLAHTHPELALYGSKMSQLTYDAVLAAASTALAAGRSVILDAAFLHPDQRLAVKKLADTSETPLCFYWLEIETEVLRSHIIRRQQAGSDLSDADLAVLDLQLAAYQRPSEPWIEHISSSDAWPGRQR
ncbi:AAA family ATPase [Mariprofundus ferrooxydans]|uniref:bifunctional aminoglycoside phosphotransferase/ATP-binding protein n=1 Tax=Mariprofundus ferrooxydans TaxID=314344 RepID=UPI00142FD649|nr:AAA family ATPase [Mariprofundus ferrooxydans]